MENKIQLTLTIEQFEQVQAIINLRAKDCFDEAFYGQGTANPEYLASLAHLANALGNHKEVEE